MFDPVAQRPLQLTQRPLIAMECSLISSRYLGYGYSSSAFELLKRLKDACKFSGGHFTLLWHNSHLLTLDDIEMYRYSLSCK